MPPENENDELKKARFYFDAVVKADEISTKSYERTNTKISLFIGVLSTVIPILTGLGYVVLSNTIAVPFFLFYAISLVLFVVALVECVHLLAPKYLGCPDFGGLMAEYDKKPLDFIIFKIATSWEDVVKDNVRRINTLFSGLQRVVQLTISGLVALAFSFSLLGIDYYIIGILSTNEPYKSMLSADGWRVTFFGICVIIFVLLITYIMRYTQNKNDNSAPNLPNASESVKEHPVSGSKMSDKNFSDAFNIALVLLAILSTAETQFLITVWGEKTALQFVTLPFILIIFVWLPKELFKSTFQKEKKNELVLSELCWELWCLTFAFYLFFLYAHQYPQIGLFNALPPLSIGFVFYLLVLLAYRTEYKKTEDEYYTSRRWKIRRLLTNIAGIGLLFVIFVFHS
jgi:hypothetical protein